jgi:hypothetical protein
MFESDKHSSLLGASITPKKVLLHWLQKTGGVSGNSGEKFLSQLESFDSDFWNDCETGKPRGGQKRQTTGKVKKKIRT